MKTINGLLRPAMQGCGNGSRWHARGTLARNKRNKKGRREAGLFADISAQAEVDLSTSR
jgi:hypothetical protein